jgi:hypothetical protein
VKGTQFCGHVFGLDVLFAKGRDVRLALTREDQQAERQARLGSDRMTFLVFADLLNGPRVKAGRSGFEIRNVFREITRHPFLSDRPIEETAQRLQASVRAFDRRSPIAQAMLRGRSAMMCARRASTRRRRTARPEFLSILAAAWTHASLIMLTRPFGEDRCAGDHFAKRVVVI